MLKVENLTKIYPSFSLKDVTFELPAGYVMGFIGSNGAGKTTTLKSIMNIVVPDSGRIEIFGKDVKTHETELKQDIGFLLGAVNSYLGTTVKKYIKMTSMFFENWQDEVCDKYLKKFGIDKDKRIKELSQGMKVKLGLAVALSHGAKLFILDEPTSGLDPVARDEILEIFSEIVSEGDKSVVFSTHITSDLERIADYILFIKEGIIVACDTKDALIESYCVVRGGAPATEEVKDFCIGIKENEFGFSALMKKEDAEKSGLELDRPTLDDIMVYYARGEER